ncbi:hypothetical protein NM688_g755 [Phlebia brevispora]|uniref:Uncharacterized protein n=1 Tax=Phlebia brevispora TaxID=194682 RepID=A0ACC1TDN6_9APHY|nr:hypothetical protein NM688_g755 [Phlebia brevispora]
MTMNTNPLQFVGCCEDVMVHVVGSFTVPIIQGMQLPLMFTCCDFLLSVPCRQQYYLQTNKASDTSAVMTVSIWRTRRAGASCLRWARGNDSRVILLSLTSEGLSFMHPYNNPYAGNPQQGAGRGQHGPAMQPAFVVHPPPQAVPPPPAPPGQHPQYFGQPIVQQPHYAMQPVPQAVPPHPAAPPQAAPPTLFLPHRLFQSSAQAVRLGQGNTPVPPQHGTQLPFIDPPHLSAQAFPASLRCKELRHPPLSSDIAQTSRIPTAVQDLPQVERLVHLRRSDVLWDNLGRYAGEMGGVARPPTSRASGPAGHRYVVQQAQAIYSLSGWFTQHMHRPETIVVNCEPAVQDEVAKQILDPLNLLLQTRYHNRVADPVRESWKLQDGGLANAPNRAFYPTWTRTCHKSHPFGGKDRAGFPDFILHKNAEISSNAAVIETKFFNTFKDEQFQNLYTPAIIDDFGQFDWISKELPTDSMHAWRRATLKIWGQLHFFRTKWGFCTNGSVVFAFVKTAPTELTISPLKRWDDPNLHRVLAGLAFASIDDGNIPQNWGIQLHDWICPVNTRVPVYA